MGTRWGESDVTVTRAFLKRWLIVDAATGTVYAREKRDHVVVGQEVGWLDDRGYRRFILCGLLFFTHRVVWFVAKGRWPKAEIDHINGVRNDNRLTNLREVSALQNSYSKKKRGSAPYKGITWYARRKTWQAQICVNYEHVHLGYRKDPKEAALLYDIAATKHFGEHAKTNRMLGLL